MDWECGDLGQSTLERLLGRLEPCGVRLFCTDDWAPYDAALPAGRHYIGKEADPSERKQQCLTAALGRPLPPPHLRRVQVGRDGRGDHGPVRPLPLQRQAAHTSVSWVKPF